MSSVGDGEWLLADKLAAWQLVVGVLGLLVTILGFVVAIVQIRRTATAAEQSHELLKGVQKRLLGNDLLLVLPELHKLEDELDKAVGTQDPVNATRVLAQYVRVAGQVSGLLESMDGSDVGEFGSLLSSARQAVSKAKLDLGKGTKRPIGTVLQTARSAMGDVSSEASAVIGRLQRKVD